MKFWDWLYKSEKAPEPVVEPVRQDDNFNGQIQNGWWPMHSGGGLANAVTGLGTFSRDKIMAGSYIDPLRITDPEIQAMYHGNDLAARIIEFQPQEMFRRGYTLCIPDPSDDVQSENSELAEEMEKYLADLRGNELLLDGMKWGRAFGGALAILGIEDGRDPSLPVNEDNIRSIKYINVIDRRFLFARSYYGDIASPKYGQVEVYQVTNAFGDQQNTLIHESRCIRFDGAPVDILKRRMLAGWTLSVLQRPYDTLRQFDSSFQAAANLLVDASQAVFKIRGLIDMIGKDHKTLETRMALTDYMRSASRAIMLDTEGEEFSRQPTAFSGIPEMMDRFMQRLASAAEMPVTVLFGRSPAGLNATGEADFRSFYDRIASRQKSELEPQLVRLFRLIALAKDSPCKGVVPEAGFEIEFHPLWQPTDLEQAQLEKTIGDRDVAYATAQILTPGEIALSRFRRGKFSLNTEIDVEARKRQMDAEMDFTVQAAEAKAQQGPQQMEQISQGQPASPQAGPLPGMQGATSDPNSGRKP